MIAMLCGAPQGWGLGPGLSCVLSCWGGRYPAASPVMAEASLGVTRLAASSGARSGEARCRGEWMAPGVTVKPINS